MAPDWLTFIDHTADAGIHVKAADLPHLYARAAFGMFSLIADLRDVRDPHATNVTVQGPDREALLVLWLSELNFLHQTRREIYSQFDVHSVTETRLGATVRGESIDFSRHTLHTEIKAVTYHGLQVAKTGATWTATVIFDV